MEATHGINGLVVDNRAHGGTEARAGDKRADRSHEALRSAVDRAGEQQAPGFSPLAQAALNLITIWLKSPRTGDERRALLLAVSRLVVTRE